MNKIQKNILQIQKEIKETCEKVGRDPAAIEILAITKGHSAEEIQEVIDTGITMIGENRIQEAEEKFVALAQKCEEKSDKKCEKHFVGHLQSNKLNKALALFDIIHAVDSIELAEKIDKRAKELDRLVLVFLEVNTSEEEQKFGFPIEELDEAFQAIHFMEHVDVAGFMTIAKRSEDEDEVRRCFNMLHDMCEFIENKHFLDYHLKLSMGMSNDFNIAIEEGADILRIGSRIFN